MNTTSPRITAETFGDVMVVHAPAELTSETASRFIEAVADAIGIGARALVVELDRTERFDSAGLESLLELQDRLQASETRLRLSGLSSVGRSIFQMTRLDTRLEIFDSIVDAVASVR